MSFWAKKQGFLIKLPKGVDQKAGMMTFERVMFRHLTSVKECRGDLFDVTSASDCRQW
jgi:SH3-like domain-containing protein